MLTPEQQKQIEKEAEMYALRKCSTQQEEIGKMSYIAGATAQAEKDNWISVKDGLPEIRKDVSKQSEEILITDGKIVQSAFFDNEGFRLFEDFYANDITHWQPLPKPPKK